jgi:hypothetical protein
MVMFELNVTEQVSQQRFPAGPAATRPTSVSHSALVREATQAKLATYLQRRGCYHVPQRMFNLRKAYPTEPVRRRRFI